MVVVIKDIRKSFIILEHVRTLLELPQHIFEH